MRNLLEGVVGDGTLEALELKSVAGRHDVVVVDDLDERLDLGALGLAGLGHAAGHLLRVALNAGDEGVREGVRLGALVDGLDDDDLRRDRVSAMFASSRYGPAVVIRPCSFKTIPSSFYVSAAISQPISIAS